MDGIVACDFVQVMFIVEGDARWQCIDGGGVFA